MRLETNLLAVLLIVFAIGEAAAEVRADSQRYSSILTQCEGSDVTLYDPQGQKLVHDVTYVYLHGNTIASNSVPASGSFQGRLIVGASGRVILKNIQKIDLGYYVTESRVHGDVNLQSEVLLIVSTPPIVSDPLVISMEELTFGGEADLRLKCGNFSSRGFPPVSVVWKDPEGKRLSSTGFKEDHFYLDLASSSAPSGDYTCQLDCDGVTGCCLADLSAARQRLTERVQTKRKPPEVVQREDFLVLLGRVDSVLSSVQRLANQSEGLNRVFLEDKLLEMEEKVEEAVSDLQINLTERFSFFQKDVGGGIAGLSSQLKEQKAKLDELSGGPVKQRGDGIKQLQDLFTPCGNPPRLDHAEPSMTFGYYGDVVTYTCNPGFRKTGGDLGNRTCNACSVWSTLADDPVCEPVCSVETAPVPENAEISWIWSEENATLTGLVKCKEDFRFPGPSGIACSASGATANWTEPDITCVRQVWRNTQETFFPIKWSVETGWSACLTAEASSSFSLDIEAGSDILSYAWFDVDEGRLELMSMTDGTWYHDGEGRASVTANTSFIIKATVTSNSSIQYFINGEACVEHLSFHGLSTRDITGIGLYKRSLKVHSLDLWCAD